MGMDRAAAVPGPDRTRKASTPVEARLRDIAAHNPSTGPLYRLGAELADLTVIQECRASSLWQLGEKWAVVSIDVGSSQAHVFEDEGPARDRHTRIAALLAAKPPHVATDRRRKGTTSASS